MPCFIKCYSDSSSRRGDEAFILRHKERACKSLKYLDLIRGQLQFSRERVGEGACESNLPRPSSCLQLCLSAPAKPLPSVVLRNFRGIGRIG